MSDDKTNKTSFDIIQASRRAVALHLKVPTERVTLNVTGSDEAGAYCARFEWRTDNDNTYYSKFGPSGETVEEAVLYGLIAFGKHGAVE